MQTHKVFTWVAGDDFRLFIQLLDEAGDPYNLDEIDIFWLLQNPDGEQVPHEHLITPMTPAEGRISLWIPHTETTHFGGGVWIDWIRISQAGIVSTLLTGPINMIADPWKSRVAIKPMFAPIGLSTESVVVTLDSHERVRRRERKAA
jgi:hypothetical protein